MAMYENEGFCPNNSFLHYAMEHNEEIPEFWKRTREILGDRPGYMVYTKAGCSYNDWCYVVDCLIGATNTMGVEIACLLQTMIPKCKYAEVGRKILITDVINPFQIPHIGRGYVNSQEKFMATSDDMHIFEDERYVCGMIDEGEAVHMYFFKK